MERSVTIFVLHIYFDSQLIQQEFHNWIVPPIDPTRVKINAKNNHGETALHKAACYSNPEGARMLLLHPTMDSANAKDNNGETAVMKAVKGGHKEVLSELVAHESVSLDIKDIWYLVWNPR